MENRRDHCKNMEDEYLCSPLNWEFYCHKEGLDEMRGNILQTSLKLDTTIVSAKAEIRRRECELIQLNDALSKVIKERDEFLAKCQKLMQEKLQLQQQLLQQKQQILQIHDNKDGASKKQNCSEPSSSSSSSSSLSCFSGCDHEKNKRELELAEIARKKKPLPEKGKLLKAVMETGPLLQTLLVAGGPLPQWQHPPPQLHSIDVPPLPTLSLPYHASPIL